jgi:hypothetical protein
MKDLGYLQHRLSNANLYKLKLNRQTSSDKKKIQYVLTAKLILYRQKIRS